MSVAKVSAWSGRSSGGTAPLSLRPLSPASVGSVTNEAVAAAVAPGASRPPASSAHSTGALLGGGQRSNSRQPRPAPGAGCWKVVTGAEGSGAPGSSLSQWSNQASCAPGGIAYGGPVDACVQGPTTR